MSTFKKKKSGGGFQSGEDVNAATEYVVGAKMSDRKAARRFNLLKSWLHDRI
jgi:hypothetical protein